MVGILFKNHMIYFLKKMYGGLVAEPKGTGHTLADLPHLPNSGRVEKQRGEGPPWKSGSMRNAPTGLPVTPQVFN
jgi:hypothetical protein